MLNLSLFKQTSAVYSLYPRRTKRQILHGKIKSFMTKHPKLALIIAGILISAFIGLLIIALANIADAGQLSAVESGNYYYHLKQVI